MTQLQNLPTQDRAGTQHYLQIDRYPDECPICHKACEPILVYGGYFGTIGSRFPTGTAVFRCPARDCDRLFLGIYMCNQNGTQAQLGLTEPREFAELGFPAAVVAVSPEFPKLFNEAAAAESDGLIGICGAGYRKALEFLIKDFVIAGGAERDKIEKKQLGECIRDHIDHAGLKDSAKRAAWLGNDETHYYRKWAEHDLGDLKSLIHMTVDWIDLVERTKKFTAEMPP